MDISSIQNIHCIGIGGSGLSGLARLLKEQGKRVSGSDQQNSSMLEALEREKIKVYQGHQAKNISPYAELIIYSSAIPEDNPERIEAKRRLLPQISYPQAIGLLTQKYKTIAICGTHGKTTTTALAALSLIFTNQDPTVIVGAPLRELHGRNEKQGSSPYFVLEACEYQRAFLNYSPFIVILNNIEADHLDYYLDLEDYKQAFRDFIDKIPKDGFLIANHDDPNIRSIAKDFQKSSIYWFGQSEDTGFQLQQNSIYHAGQKLMELHLQIPGQHNLMNATAVITLMKALRLDLSKAKEALESYQGAARRFEYKGTIGNTIIIDDYGHHPTEIAATLKAAREKFGQEKKILCVFQPHQYSRTYKLLDEFAVAFKDADEVIIPNIYQARDTLEDMSQVNEELLVQKIKEVGTLARFGHGLEETTKILKAEAGNYDVIITMGAGDVWKVIPAKN